MKAIAVVITIETFYNEVQNEKQFVALSTPIEEHHLKRDLGDHIFHGKITHSIECHRHFPRVIEAVVKEKQELEKKGINVLVFSPLTNDDFG